MANLRRNPERDRRVVTVRVESLSRGERGVILGVLRGKVGRDEDDDVAAALMGRKEGEARQGDWWRVLGFERNGGERRDSRAAPVAIVLIESREDQRGIGFCYGDNGDLVCFSYIVASLCLNFKVVSC